MSTIRKMIWIIGITLTLLTNLSGSMPRMYKGVQHEVGSDVVNVYSVQGLPHETPIPVMAWESTDPNDPNGKLVDTGQSVQVYLKNTYKDDLIAYYPRMTLWIVGATILLHFATGLFITKQVAG